MKEIISNKKRLNNILITENKLEEDKDNLKKTNSDCENINKKKSIRKKSLQNSFIIFLLSIFTRFLNIESGSHVVWDEAHFGKFGASYLKRKFFFDVHPPLGKLMTAFSGYIFDQDVKFKFESGESYPKNFNYIGMRRFHALIGSFIPLFAELTLKELGFESNSFLFALMWIFENGFISISRLILLDAHLMIFQAASIYFVVKFYMRKDNKNLNLFFLGVSLGCVASVKWIGCITVLLVGLLIIKELWDSLISETFIIFIRKFIQRAVFLIVLPISIYLSLFVLHFIILNKDGGEVSYMDSTFTHYIKGNKDSVYKYVDYGSVITLKNEVGKDGFLHSHPSKYPNTELNQITTYFHKDSNNNYAFQKINSVEGDTSIVKDGDVVAIVHLVTKTYLRISEEKTYSNKIDYRAEGHESVTLASSFIIEIDYDMIKKENAVKSMTTKFRIKSKKNGFYLRSISEKLPKWGFSQTEVVFTKNKHQKGCLWNIEENNNTHKDTQNIKYSELGNMYRFFPKFIYDYNVNMFNVNKSFLQSEDEEPQIIVSKPYEWFILKRGMRVNTWKGDDYKFYFFGNPLTWYLSSICVLLSPIILTFKCIELRRKKMHLNSLKNDFFIVFLASGGWFIHYFPFFYIKRVLYFHHYYPCLFFALFSIAYIFNNVSFRNLKFFGVLIIFTFLIYSPLTYGVKTPEKTLKFLKLFETWDFF